jgi:hypothetical protein
MGYKNSFYTTEVQLYVTEQVRNGQYVQCIAPILLSFLTDGPEGRVGADTNDSKTSIVFFIINLLLVVHFNQYFLCMRCWFSGFYKSFLLLYTIINFYLLLWNYLLILKMLTETLVRIPFLWLVERSQAPTSHWLQGKCSRINLSQAASGMILQNNRLPVSIFTTKITAIVSLTRVTGGILNWYISIREETENCKNYQRTYRRHLLKNIYSSRDTIPFQAYTTADDPRFAQTLALGPLGPLPRNSGPAV